MSNVLSGPPVQQIGKARHLFINENTFALQKASEREYRIEASDLGLKPGEIPNQIETSLGNGQNFALLSYDEHRFVYRQIVNTLVLVVFND